MVLRLAFAPCVRALAAEILLSVVPLLAQQHIGLSSDGGAREAGGDWAGGDGKPPLRKAGDVSKARDDSNRSKRNTNGAASFARAEVEAAKLLAAARGYATAARNARAKRAACARTAEECRLAAKRAVEAMQARVLLLQAQYDKGRAAVSAALERNEPMNEVMLLSAAGSAAEKEMREAEAEAGTASKRLEQLFPTYRCNGGA